MSVSKEKVLEQLNRERLIELAKNLAGIVSITGEEREVAEYLGGEFARLGMEIKYQEVEEGRPNVIAILKGSGSGPTPHRGPRGKSYPQGGAYQ